MSAVFRISCASPNTPTCATVAAAEPFFVRLLEAGERRLCHQHLGAVRFAGLTIVRRSFTPLAMLKVVGPGSRPSSIVTIISARVLERVVGAVGLDEQIEQPLGSQPTERAIAKASP